MKLIYKIVAALVLVTAVLAVGTPVAVAQEQVPGDPINYYGDAVATDGVLAPEGTTIVAVVDGEVQDEITVETPGEYGDDDAFDDKLVVGSDAGAEVSFHVGDANGPEATESPLTLDAPAGDEGVQEQLLTFPAGTFDANEAPSVDDIILSFDESEIQVGQQTSATVQATLDEQVDGRSVRVVTHDIVESRDPDIATVDERTVTGEAGGTATFEAEYAGVTDNTDVTVVDPAPFFEIDITNIPDDVVEGEEITVDYEVDNTGLESGQQNIEFNVSGETVGTESDVSLDTGETFTGQFTYTATEDDIGDLDIELSTADDTAAEAVTVLEEPFFDVEIENIDDSVTVGQTLLVDANITNTGGAADTQNITLDIDDEIDSGSPVDNESVSLNGGNSETVTLAWSTAGVSAVDNVDVTAGSDNSSDTEQINIESAEDPFFAVSITDIQEEVVEGDTITVNYTVDNTGVGEDTQNITFEVDGTEEDTREVAALSETDDGEFTYETDNEDLSEVDISLASENDTAVETVSVLEDAFFQVDIDNVADSDVLASLDNVEVDATITNTGEVEEQQDIRLSVDTEPTGETFEFNKEDVDTEQISLAGGEEKTVTLTYETEAGDAPELAFEVASNNDNATDTASIEEPDDPSYNVSITGLTSTVEAGEDVEIDYEVENTGELDGDAQDIEFNVSGETAATESDVELTAGETFQDSFTYPTDIDDTGNLDIGVSSDDDTATTTVTVEEPADLSIAEFDANNIDIDADENATVGQQIQFTGTIENNGGVGATAEVAFDVDGTTENDASRYVPGGTQVAFDFSYVPDNGDVQEDLPFKLDLTDAGNEQVTVDVEEAEADFTVQDVAIETPGENNEVSSGERVTITTTIDNTEGDGAGSRLVNITENTTDADGNIRIVNRTEVQLGQDEQREVSLTDLVPTAAEGADLEYTVDVVDDTQTNTEDIDVLESPNLQINSVEEFANLGGPDDVVAGEDSIEINAAIENTGDIEATQSVSLLLDGSVIDQQDITLDGGVEETITFSSEANENNIGEDQNVRVRTNEDSSQDTITVLAPAEVVIDVADVSEPVAGDDTLDVTIDYENVGDVGFEAGSQTLTISAGDLGAESEVVSPDGGAEGTKTLSLNTEANDDGEYDILITSVSPSGNLDAVTSSEATVLAPANISTSVASISNPVRADEDTVEAEAEIENTGDVETTVDVDFDADGDTKTTQGAVTIDAGQTETVTFSSFEPIEANEELNVEIIADGTDVTEATAEEVIEVLEPFDDPLLRVSNLNINDETPREDAVLRATGNDNEQITITADVENIGDLQGTQTIELSIGNSVEDTEEITLNGAEQSAVSFSVDPDTLRSGDRSVTIDSTDSSQSSSISVRDFVEPTFEVELSDDLADELSGTDQIEANITNIGDGSASQSASVELVVDDETIADTDFDSVLEPDEKETITLDVPPNDTTTRAGEIEGQVTISASDDSEEETVTVDFGEIQDAVNAAEPGGVVNVSSGTYQEDITIDKTVEIAGSGATVEPDQGDTPVTFESRAAGSELFGLEFQNAQTGIDIKSNRITITQSVFRPSVDDGLNISGTEATIENNRLIDNQRAINLTNADGTLVRQNELLGSQDRAINSTDTVMTVTDNNIESDNVAIDADRGFIDATNNWWGTPGGPVDEVDILSPVDFDPWSTQSQESPDVQFGETDIGEVGEVVEGETQTIDATIENNGGTSGVTEGEVQLTLDSDELDSFTFDAEDPSGEELEIDIDSTTAESTDEGTLKLSILLDDTEQAARTETVDVFTAPEFNVDITDPASSTTFTSDETLSVDAEVENVGQATGEVTADLLFDGAPLGKTKVTVAGTGTTGDQQDTVTLTRTLDDSDVGNAVPVAVDVTPGDTDTIDVSVTQASDSGDGTSSSSSSSSGISPSDEEGQTAEALEAVTEAVDQAEASSDTERTIEDADPDTPGVTVDVSDEAESVESINFDDEETAGSVRVREYSDESVVDSTSQSLSAQLSQDVRTVGTVADITVTNDQGEPTPDTPATVTMGINADDVDNTDNVVINHETADGWEQLDTSVEEVTENRVRVSAPVDGFSLFAVAEIQDSAAEPADDGTTDTDETADDGSEDSDSGIGTTGIIGIVVLIVLLIAALIGFRQMSQGGGNGGI